MTAKLFPACGAYACLLFFHGKEFFFYASAPTAFGAFTRAVSLARADGVTNDADADTADIFIQLCAFGDVIYS